MQAPASWLRLARPLAIAALVAATAGTARAQFRESIPSRIYYLGVEQLYRGELRDAQRTFNRCLTGAIKTLNAGGTVRWIDSICYHTMLGEVYYHWGQPDKALEQFNYACTLYLQYPKWMLRVQFDQQLIADASLVRTAVPWGASQRGGVPGKFAAAISVAQGQLDITREVQQGGVIMQPQLWPVNVVEVVRCTALAIRRRNEILGPLGAHDSISKSMVVNLGRGGAPPNHWSNAWVDVQRGLALAGVGDKEEALQVLERGLLVAGQFDHPLTSISLLEQGKLALNAGNYSAAAGLFAEAGYSAYLYEDPSTIDESFRWMQLTRLAANAGGVNPTLQVATAWARRERLDLIAARLQLSLADELMSAGDWKNAPGALAAGAALVGDARVGILGNWAAYLDARIQQEQGRGSADAALASAVEGQRGMSLQNFQINLANRMFDAQTLPTRTAGPVYEVLLRDPAPADALLRPLETLAIMTTPHEPAFERWLLTALERRNLAYAMEITERAKRRRFHNAIPWGGRIAAIRDLVATPAPQLTPEQKRQQSDVLRRFPDLAEAVAEEAQLRAQLDAAWRPPLEGDAQRKATKLWGDYADALARREQQLRRMALARVPSELSFPTYFPALELQKKLQPGQALLVYHDTPEGMLGILITARASTHWNCGPTNRLAGLVAQFLRDLGNHDASHEMTAEELADLDWQKSGEQLFQAMFEGSSLSPSAMTELVVVPDGIAWYVPFEALVAEVDGKKAPLVTYSKVRYAPTAGLAFSFDGSWRRVQRTGIVPGDLLAGERPEQRLEAIQPLQSAIDGGMPLTAPAPAQSPVLATLLDQLIVLDEVDLQAGEPFDWAPLAIDRNLSQGSIETWLSLPSSGPQRIALPGMRTAAERGGRTSRRRGAATSPGDELFFASCSLMSAGAETILLSRWRVGGQSTLDLVREFMQELPHTPAAAAWQRSVQLSMEAPIDPLSELRVKAGKDPVELTAAHPFFWAGYLVVDSGWRPPEPEPPADATAPVAAAPAGNAPGDPPPAAAPAPGAMAPGQTAPPVPPNPQPGAAGEESMTDADAPQKKVTPPPPPTPPSDRAARPASQPAEEE